MKKKIKVELLAPAGSPEKLKYAIKYGADAVYAGVPDVSMRARVNTFTEKDLLEAAKFVHSEGKKIFVTLNIYAHNYHLAKIEAHLKFLKKVNVDAVIVADPGVIMLVKKHLPKVAIHLSTQANTTNWQAAKFWYDLGVTRIVLAREVTLEDIAQIKKHVPKLELEYFVHGAMCMSYSGRCILSKWMSGKSANLGDCTQPCRWAYRPTCNTQLTTNNNKTQKIRKALSVDSCESSVFKTMEVEEVQSGRPILLEEDSHGTYFFNSKDLNLLSHLRELRNAGVTSFKIEGRNKSVFYVANVCRAYRSVLSAIESKKTALEARKIEKWASKELDKLANRGYTKGFLLGNEPEHGFEGQQANGDFQFVGEILASSGAEITAKIHNVVKPGDKLEIIDKEKNIAIKVLAIYNQDREEVSSAHGGHGKLYFLKINKKDVQPYSLLRKIG
ncbi:MAG: Peptidase U32 [Candidatus Moranbacteria bacterium GW2011_GWD2_36_12]|nr:MAG: Peptidase U32 [Candidatus Moranbacteria bacterium GW2011_GWD2_36_12]KKQ06107.1 MAG: Peptidase U32 [Candidatus Moranbacteria bacterium GW2011_GWE2_36_40]